MSTAFLSIDGIRSNILILKERTVLHMIYSTCCLKVIKERYCGDFCATALAV
jgi:hypothetical protein